MPTSTTLMTAPRNYSVNSPRKKVSCSASPFVKAVLSVMIGLDWDEELLLKYYDQPVNYGSDSLFFNIAVKVLKKERIIQI